MPASRKLIKSRIKSVKNTRKITKAMELVAASKMRKAVAATLRGRPYVRLAKETIESVMAKSANVEHVLLQQGKGTRELVIVFTSDRGLAGGYNVNMIKFARDAMRQMGDVDVIAVGKRGSDALQRLKFNVVASFTGLGNAPQYQDIVPVARMALDGFTNGTYGKVHLYFTDFVSGVTQTPTAQIVLPYGSTDAKRPAPDSLGTTEYTMEPNPHELLSQMIPRLVMASFYQALLESSASEHAARMLAMKNASDSARDMMESLTFTYNQVRQAGITQEIAEISSGAAALS
jgi:F-type H+-transporting ATPase subunit gamma